MLKILPRLGVAFLKEVWIAIVLCVVDPTQSTSKNFHLKFRGGRTVNSCNMRSRLGFLEILFLLRASVYYFALIFAEKVSTKCRNLWL